MVTMSARINRISAAMEARFCGMDATVGSGALSGAFDTVLPRFGNHQRRASTCARWRRVAVSSDRMSASVCGAASIWLIGVCCAESAALSVAAPARFRGNMGTLLRPVDMIAVPACTDLRSTRMLLKWCGISPNASAAALSARLCREGRIAQHVLVSRQEPLTTPHHSGRIAQPHHMGVQCAYPSPHQKSTQFCVRLL